MTTEGQQQPFEPERPAEEVSKRGAPPSEVAAIKLGFADIEAGRLVPDVEVNAWLDDWVSGRDVRIPA